MSSIPKTRHAITSLRPYAPSPVAKRFHACHKLVRGIKGPVGSGKSVMCAMELFSRSLEQSPDANGIRKTRHVIIRNTFPQLISTSLKTVMDWIPEGVAHYSMSSPVSGVIDLPLSDGTRVYSEWLFIACDVEADIARLKSLEVTMVWINEASEIARSVLDQATVRVGRYPSKDDGGATFHGVIFDTNPPDDTHWVYELGEVKKPDEFVLFNQPPALIRVVSKDKHITYIPNDGKNPQCSEPAENIEHLTDGFNYYLKGVNSGKDEEWIKVFILGQYGSTMTGRPVFPEFNDSLHSAKEPLTPYKGLPLLLGWDFGLNASCVFCQLTPKGCLNVIDELTSESMGIQRFVRDMVKPKIKNEYPEMKLLGVGDPAGGQRSQTTEQTCLQILAEEGFDVEPASTNEFVARREAVSHYLTRLTDGAAGFQLSPKCTVLRKGMLGKYCYRRMKIAGSERYTDRPEKNIFSHLQDALQYAALYYRGNANVSGNSGLGMGHERRNVKTVDFKGWT